MGELLKMYTSNNPMSKYLPDIPFLLLVSLELILFGLIACWTSPAGPAG